MNSKQHIVIAHGLMKITSLNGSEVVKIQAGEPLLLLLLKRGSEYRCMTRTGFIGKIPVEELKMWSNIKQH